MSEIPEFQPASFDPISMRNQVLTTIRQAQVEQLQDAALWVNEGLIIVSVLCGRVEPLVVNGVKQFADTTVDIRYVSTPHGYNGAVIRLSNSSEPYDYNLFPDPEFLSALPPESGKRDANVHFMLGRTKYDRILSEACLQEVLAQPTDS